MRTRSLACLLACASLLLATDLRAEEDDWFGEDKALHYGASAALASAGYGGCALVFDSVWLRLGSGACLAISGGFSKELLDLALEGTFSWRDLTWDAAGMVTGLLVVWSLDQLPALVGGSPPPPREELEAGAPLPPAAAPVPAAAPEPVVEEGEGAAEERVAGDSAAGTPLPEGAETGAPPSDGDEGAPADGLDEEPSAPDQPSDEELLPVPPITEAPAAEAADVDAGP